MVLGPLGKKWGSPYYVHLLRFCRVVPSVDCLLQSVVASLGLETVQGLCLYWDCYLTSLTVLDFF